MKDHILIVALAFVLWAWINLRVMRTREQIVIHKQTKEILQKRLKGKNKSGEKQGKKATALKKIEDLPQATRKFKMNAYPYLQKERRVDIERRKSRVQGGLIFENIERRRGGKIVRVDSRDIGVKFDEHIDAKLIVESSISMRQS